MVMVITHFTTVKDLFWRMIRQSNFANFSKMHNGNPRFLRPQCSVLMQDEIKTHVDKKVVGTLRSTFNNILTNCPGHLSYLSVYMNVWKKL